MTTKLIALILAFTVGCGAILNGGPATIMVPPGAAVDGMQVNGPIQVSKQTPHEVAFPDGRRCIIASNVSVGYVIADIVLWFLVGLVVDGVTGDWKVLNADECMGAIVQ